MILLLGNSKGLFNLIFYILFAIVAVYLSYIFLFVNDFWLLISSVVLVITTVFVLLKFLIVFIRGNLPSFSDWFRFGTFLSLEFEAFLLLHRLDNFGFVRVFGSVSLDSFYFFKASLVIAIGILALSFVDYLIVSPTIPMSCTKKIKVEMGRAKLNVLLLFSFLLLLLNIFFSVTNVIGYGSKIGNTTGFIDFFKQFANVFLNLGFAALSIYYFFSRLTLPLYFRLLFYLFICLNLIFALLSGMKESVITVLLFVIIPYLISGGRLKLLYILSFLFLLSVLFPFNKNYRKALEFTNNKTLAIIWAVEKIYSGKIEKNETSISSRFFAFSPLMYGVAIEKDWDYYKFMNRYLYIPVAWIVPGALIPGKPRNDFGRILYQDLRDTQVSNVSITPTTYGWAYLEGGYFFVFLVFFVFGILLKYLDNIASLVSFKGLLIYVILVPSLVKIESDIYFRIVGYFQLLLCLFFIRLLIGDLKLYK